MPVKNVGLERANPRGTAEALDSWVGFGTRSGAGTVETAGLCSGEIRRKKLEYFFVGKLGLVGKEQVTGVFEQDELCARNSA
jgi:hypothetical protein